MKIISEYKLTEEEIKNYRGKGYEVYYGYENPVIKQGESVGILLDVLYKSSIELIEYLLHRKIKSKLTIKYKNQVYKLNNLEDWKHTWYEDHHWHSNKHIILIDYETKRKEYFEEQILLKSKERTNEILVYLDNKIPEDLDYILETFTRLYDINVDYSSLDDKLRAYTSIQYYIANDIEYAKDIIGTDPTEEPMFDVISFGNETYLEDMVYKDGVVS